MLKLPKKCAKIQEGFITTDISPPQRLKAPTLINHIFLKHYAHICNSVVFDELLINFLI